MVGGINFFKNEKSLFHEEIYDFLSNSSEEKVTTSKSYIIGVVYTIMCAIASEGQRLKINLINLSVVACVNFFSHHLFGGSS